MQSFVSVSELSRERPRDTDDYVVFGGTFDPFHHGHLDAVRLLLEVFRRVIIAPTLQNPWKTGEPAPLEDRRQMIRLILEAERLPLAAAPAGAGTSIEESGYEFAADLVQQLRARLGGRLYWAVGEDSADGVRHWRNFAELGVPVVTLPIRVPEHSTDIRQKTVQLHPAIVSFAAARKLYR